MNTMQSIREKHNAVASQARELVEVNNSAWNDDLQAKYDNFMTELDSLKNQSTRLEAVLHAANQEDQKAQIIETTEKAGKSNPYNQVFLNWVKGGDKALSAEDWATVRNTMSTTTGSEGGFTVPSDILGRVADALKQTGAMRSVAQIITTDNGAPLSYPMSNGTSEVGELIAENTAATAADPSFGQAALTAYKFSSKVIAVPMELLQDSAVDMEAFLAQRIADRVARVQNQYFTTGTGTNQPNGAVTAAASGKVGTTGQTATVIYDDIIDLVHSVDPAYRANPNCVFMMNDASLKVIRKIKDSTGRPIFLPGYDLNGQAPDTVLGYRVATNPDMATMAANTKSILFGDFNRYIIRDVMGIALFRFDDSNYASKGQVGFLAWSRAGGNLCDNGGAVKYYQNSAT